MKKLIFILFLTIISGCVPAFCQITPQQINCLKGTATGINSYSVTISCANMPIDPFDGMEIAVTFSVTNTGASTLKLNTSTPRAIQFYGVAIASAAIKANSPVALKYRSSDNTWQMQGIDILPVVNGGTGTTLASGVQYANSPLSITTNTISLTSPLPIINGGTNATTANAALNNLAPSQSGNAGYFWQTDGTNTSWTAVPSATVTAWGLTGNSGTVDGTNFIGTTDNQSFSIRTNNTRRIKIDSLGQVGIGTSSPLFPLEIKSDANSGYLFSLNRDNASNEAAIIKFQRRGVNKWAIGNGAQNLSGHEFSIFDFDLMYSPLYINNTGRVGLGYNGAAGTYWVQVSGTDRFSLNLLNTTAETSWLSFSKTAVGGVTWTLGADISATGSHSFGIANLTTAKAAIFIDSLDRVGFGNNLAPKSVLDVIGVVQWRGAVTTYTATTSSYTVTAAELAGGTLRVAGTGTVTIYLPSATALGTQLGWAANKVSVFPFSVLNESTGIVTLVVGAGMTVSTYPTITDANELLIPITATSVFQIASYNATTANIKRIQ